MRRRLVGAVVEGRRVVALASRCSWCSAGGVAGETFRHGPGEAATAPSGGLGHRSVPAAVERLVEDLDPQLEQVVVEWFGVVQPPVRLDGLDRMLVWFAEQHRRPEVGEVEGVGCQSTLAMVWK